MTRRESVIFNMLLEGSVPKEISETLKISYETVLSHQKNLYRKLGVHSVSEMLEKYRNKKEEPAFVPAGNKCINLLQLKFLIPAGAVLLLVSALLVLLLVRSNQPENRTEDPTAAYPPVIYMEDGTYWTLHTYYDIPFYAIRGGDMDTGYYGESYNSPNRVRLGDIYSGTFDNLLPHPTVNGSYKLRLSGIVDKELKYMQILFQYVVQDDRNNWIHLGGTTNEKMVSIGPGTFSEVIEFTLDGVDIDVLPEGYVTAIFVNQLFTMHGDYIFDSGERIPDDIPDGAVWATISKLRIEPVGR